MGEAANERDGRLRMIRDSAAGIAAAGDLGRIRRLRFTEPGFDRATWAEMAALGWPGLCVAEADGGSGFGAAELCALAEVLGAALVPEPMIAAAVIAPLLDAATRDEVLAGRRIVLPAWTERAAALPAALPTGPATRLGSGRITGTLRFIPMAAGADAFLVRAREGIALVVRDAAGAVLTTERTQDGGHFGTLSLEDAPALVLPGDVDAAIEATTLATAAELLGLAERAFAITLDYLRTRVQFGRAIGSFQALQHRAADLRLQLALARVSIDAAAITLDAGASPDTARAAVSRAKARASDMALLVTRQAIQLHGGIGYTDEHEIGLYLRRAMVLANLHGSAALHRARYAALAPEEDD
jgi:alkylation response protein AidB-like acyl-CoA dehydrogenase